MELLVGPPRNVERRIQVEGAARRCGLRFFRIRPCDRPYTCHKAVALPRNRHDVTMLARLFSERPAQDTYVESEIAFLNKSIGPDQLHQLIFLHHLPAVFDQRQQRGENLLRQRRRFIVAKQTTSHHINSEGIELVEMYGRTTHSRSKNLGKKTKRTSKDF